MKFAISNWDPFQDPPLVRSSAYGGNGCLSGSEVEMSLTLPAR